MDVNKMAKSEARRTFDNWVRGAKSDNTRDARKRVVPQFLELVCGKTVDDLIADDLEKLTANDIDERYVDVLRNWGLKDATIVNYMSNVKSYMARLRKNNVFDIDFSNLINDTFTPDDMKKDQKNRGTMTVGDFERLHAWVLDYPFSKRYSGKNKKYALALRFMFVTAIRIDSVFNNIHWNNIKLEEDAFGNTSYVIYALDKGAKVNRKPISDEFYAELREELFEGDEQALIFGDISKQGLTKLTSQFAEENNLEFTPHSIKNSAGTKLYNMTRDLLKVSKFLDHENPKTTLRYIRIDENFADTGSYLMSSNINIEDIKKIEYNELVKIISARPELALAIITDAKRGGVL